MIKNDEKERMEEDGMQAGHFERSRISKLYSRKA
jgi:hypothetical protein